MNRRELKGHRPQVCHRKPVETAATPLTSTRQKKAGLRAAVRAVDTQAAQATHVIVRRLSNRQDIATGSVYFTHDTATGAVDITSASRDCCMEGRRRSACSSACAAAAVFVRSSRRARRSPASGFPGR